MHAADVMATNVITVTPDTSVKDLAAVLSRHGISGVPVVDAANALVGIVSEGDLLHRAETGTERRTERRRVRWLDSFAADRDLARDYVKSHANTVGDVMTRDVITVSETAALDDVANLLEINRIKRVPVVRDGNVVGIISRANLVRALAAMQNQPAATEADVDDRTIRQMLLAELRGQEWARVWDADVVVRGGVVHLWCSDDRSEEQRQALRVAAENTPGVRSVEMHILSAPMFPPI
ncbi:MAG: CBS domain-containing protein [Acetobacteraceae bacterium]|jgi:CBS domain-containing protein